MAVLSEYEDTVLILIKQALLKLLISAIIYIINIQPSINISVQNKKPLIKNLFK